jgi:hypothetical protein
MDNTFMPLFVALQIVIGPEFRHIEASKMVRSLMRKMHSLTLKVLVREKQSSVATQKN